MAKNNSEQIFVRIKNKREKAVTKANAKVREQCNFKVGELVLVKANQQSNAVLGKVAKFSEIYEGPYIVTKIIGNATYEIAYLTGKKKTRGIFNVRLLRRYHRSCEQEGDE